MKQMIRIPFRKLLFVMTLMLGMIIAMSATSLAEGNVLSKGATYTIGEAFTIEEDDQYVYLADEQIDSKEPLPKGTYKIEEPYFDEDNKVWIVPISEEYELTLGSGMGFTGEETITGVECKDGTGAQNDAFSFRIIGKSSGGDNPPVSYLAWDDTEKKLVKSTCESYTFLKNASKDEAGYIGKEGLESWYVVDEDITSDILTKGDVHLILKDGVILTSDYEGAACRGGSLTIYAQSAGENAGTWNVETNNRTAIETTRADLIINGGKISVISNSKNTDYGAIFLWNYNDDRCNLTINGGEVTAICGSGSGIYVKGDVTINGGVVNSTSTLNGYGICVWDNVIVNDGIVTAKSKSASCIATSEDAEGGSVEIHGGRTTAECTGDHSGIEAEDVEIDGGIVTASGKGDEDIAGGIYLRGDNRILDIGAGMTVMAGDNEENAKDVTEEYKGQYAKKLIEDWVRISDPIFTVTFKDDQGNILATRSVVKGDAAEAPQIPARAGYTSKWDKDFSKVTEDMTVIAVYEPIKVTSLRFRYIPKQLFEGSEDGIAVSISPTNALDKSVQYTSSDPEVLTVSEKGRIKAIKEGKATVKVKTLDGSGLSVSRSIKVLHTHVWGDWEETTPATTEADGEETRTCSGCGETETRAIPKLEHEHDLYLVKGTDATCTASGTKDYYECTGCEAIFEDGKGEKQTSFGDLDIPATGHNIGEPAKEGDETAPTCSLPGGYNVFTRCENCGAVLVQERYVIPIDPDAHVWDEGVVTKEATETETGIMTYTCKEDPSHTKTEVIPKLVSIANAKVVLSASSFAYNGKVRKPSIKTINGKALKSGADYTVTWSNNSSKNVGSYTVTITGKGNYTGVTKATYNITPKGTSLKTPKKAKKAITVKWKRQAAKMSKSRITGYQIQLATDKKFTKNRKTVNVKGYKKVSRKVKRLKAKKKYYIRIRTYKTVSGKNYYSGWSKVKTAKTR